MAAKRALRSGKSLRRRMLATLIAADLAFKILAAPAFLHLTTGTDDLELVGALVVGTLFCITILALLLRPLVRWRDAPSPVPDELVRQAILSVRKLPAQTAIVYAASWWVPMLIVAIAGDHLTLAVGLSIAATTFGPLPIGFVFAERIIATSREQLAIASRRLGVYVTSRAGSLRQRILILCTCLGLAPFLYLASVGMSVASGHTDPSVLPTIYALGGIGGLLYIGVCALVFGGLLARPISNLTEVASTIAIHGNTADIGRLPLEHDDEIGQLAGWTNRMLDRLQESDAERAAARASLESLNRSLERHVAERTARLAETNAALETEMQQRLAVEADLRQAQKLEAIGRLAAGVAHEINSPIQYVSDSLSFIEEAHRDLVALSPPHVALMGAALHCTSCRPHAEAVRAIREERDCEYVIAELPAAFERARDGVTRVATIVRSMNQFAHADGQEMSSVELNSAISSTLAIASNEYKYVADLETDFAPLPLVTCFGGAINQVVLNLVVNAAHAIADVVANTGRRGKITVRTRATASEVVISVSDTGGGIPDEIKDRIFDPFFTTKDVGRGTGQGLAIARSVMEKHHGDLELETTPGVGTTFHMRLPITPSAAAPVAAPAAA